MKHIHTFESLLNESANGYELSIKKLEDNEYVVKATKGGKEVGELRFIKSKFLDALKATIVSVDPNHRRQGIASSMYMYAEKELKTKFVQNDEVLTADGKALWNSASKQWGKKL